MTIIEKQIIQRENELRDAMKRSDIDVLNDILHDNLVFNLPNGYTITKLQDIENYKSGLMIVLEIIFSDQIIQVLDDIATVSVTAHLQGSYNLQSIDDHFRFLRVWKKCGNDWKVIAGSSVNKQ